MRQPKASVNSKDRLWFTLHFMLHMSALSHFFGWSSAFFVSLQRTTAAPRWSRTVQKPLPAQSYSLPLSTPAPTGLCVHDFNFSPFNFIFLCSHSSAKPAFQHSKCASPSTGEEEGMTEQRCGGKSCPCSSSTAQDQHRSACKAQSCKAQLSCLSGSPRRAQPPHSPWSAHLLPLGLKVPKGQQKAPGSKGQVSNITSITPEPGKQPSHPQAAQQE